jgi:murein DD-endopeptidase MepM/ murein hydrolase activator NlpD
MIDLRLPLRNVQVNQPFGVNYLDFYKQWGLTGHNGVDLMATTGFKCYAAHAGLVTFARVYDDGAVAIGGKPMQHIEITDYTGKYKTIYLHLEKILVKENQHVEAGDLIGLCDNTGKYTTGDHLHFGLKLTDENGNTINYDNGFSGAIDPTPYFNMAFDGTPIGNKDCYKSNAYHRYYRGRPAGGLKNEIRIVAELTPYLFKNGLRRLPNNEEINAATYGGWDREAIINTAMRFLWAYVKKDDYLNKGIKPFQD